MTSESAARKKRPVNTMSEINCYKEIMPRPRIEIVTLIYFILKKIYLFFTAAEYRKVSPERTILT